METALRMPDLATTDSTIKVVRWLIETGQSVRRGQPLLEVETDKATMDVESIATGRLKTVHVKPGEAVAAGAMIAVIETENEGPAEPAPAAPSAQAAPPPALPSPAGSKKTGGMFARNRETAQKRAGT
jgi:pyruvate dehydrogenase E2 component (dihydrolipoamide acetyltransferase)